MVNYLKCPPLVKKLGLLACTMMTSKILLHAGPAMKVIPAFTSSNGELVIRKT